MFETNICVFADISCISYCYVVAVDFFAAMIWNISTVNYMIGVKLSLKQSSFTDLIRRESTSLTRARTRQNQSTIFEVL